MSFVRIVFGNMLIRGRLVVSGDLCGIKRKKNCNADRFHFVRQPDRGGEALSEVEDEL